MLQIHTTDGYKVQLSYTGGSGTGAITYARLYGTTAAGCSVTTAGLLTATSSSTCNVNVTKAADANYYIKLIK